VALSQRERNEETQSFRPLPPRHHTFGPTSTESMPRKTVSLAFAAIVVAVPWLLLIALVSEGQPWPWLGRRSSLAPRFVVQALTRAAVFAAPAVA
jgi:hypothetical protein